MTPGNMYDLVLLMTQHFNSLLTQSPNDGDDKESIDFASKMHKKWISYQLVFVCFMSSFYQGMLFLSFCFLFESDYLPLQL